MEAFTGEEGIFNSESAKQFTQEFANQFSNVTLNFDKDGAATAQLSSLKS
jgi:hypothetical protein